MSYATPNVRDWTIDYLAQWAKENNIDPDAARREPLAEPVDRGFLGPEYDFTPEDYIDKAWLKSLDDVMRNFERGTVVVGDGGHTITGNTLSQVNSGVDLTVGQGASYNQYASTGSSGFCIAAPSNMPSPSCASAEPLPTTIPFQFGTGTNASFSYTVSTPSGSEGELLAAGSNGWNTDSTQRTTLLDRTNTPEAKRRRKGTPQAAAPSAGAGGANAAGSSTQRVLGPHAQSYQNILPRNTTNTFEDLSFGHWAILGHLHPFDADLGAEGVRYEAQSGSKNSRAITRQSQTHPVECKTCRAEGTATFHQSQTALKRHSKMHKPVHHFRCTMCAAVVLDRPDKATAHWAKGCKAYKKLREKGIAWHWAALHGMFDHAQFAGREYMWA